VSAHRQAIEPVSEQAREREKGEKKAIERERANRSASARQSYEINPSYMPPASLSSFEPQH
jgi:hypothetical protein